METTIHWATFMIDPSLAPPFNVDCGFISNYEVVSKINNTLFNCEHVLDAADKIEEFCKKTEILFHEKFTLLYPIYQSALGTEHEDTMNEIAEIIMEEAKIRNWEFARIGGLTGLSEGNFFVEKIEIEEPIAKRVMPPISENMVFGRSDNHYNTDHEFIGKTDITLTIKIVLNDDVEMEYHIVETGKQSNKQTLKGKIVSSNVAEFLQINTYEPSLLSYYFNTETKNWYSKNIE